VLEVPRRGDGTGLTDPLSAAIALSNSPYLSIVARNRSPGDPDSALKLVPCLVFSIEEPEPELKSVQEGSDKDRRSGDGGDDRKFRDAAAPAPIPEP